MKEFLSQRGVRYNERDVSRDRAAADEMTRKSGQMGVPVIIMDGEVIIGFDRRRLEGILASRKPERPGIGLQVGDAARLAERFGVAPVPGALVGKVAPSSPGEKSGLIPGDIITGVNSQPVRNADDLTMAIASLTPGVTVTITFIRNDIVHKAEIRI